MNETFFLSNILPQNYENNGNFWYKMEVFCRNLTKQFSDVYVISGPLWLPRQQDGKKIVQYEVRECMKCASRLLGASSFVNQKSALAKPRTMNSTLYPGFFNELTFQGKSIGITTPPPL